MRFEPRTINVAAFNFDGTWQVANIYVTNLNFVRSKYDKVWTFKKGRDLEEVASKLEMIMSNRYGIEPARALVTMR